jgi:hypothetical protein
VICGANFIHLETNNSFTPWTRTFDTWSLTWSIRDFCLSFTKIFRRTDSRPD